MRFIKKIRILLLIFIAVLGVDINAQDIDSTIPVRPVLSYDFSAESDLTRYPLKPPDTRSPRGTLLSFIESMNRSHRILMEAHEKNQASAIFNRSVDIGDLEEQAEILFSRAASCMDLSKIPSAIVADKTYEKALLLKEILDRITLPIPEEVPDLKAIEREAETRKVLELHQYWIPNTDIVIKRIEEGPRQGEYLFSYSTVDQLEEFYEKVKDLPYKGERYTSDNYYSFYISSPGGLLPPRWSHYIPGFLTSKTYLSQTPWQWLGFFLALAVLMLFVRFSFKVIIRILGVSSQKKNLWQKGLFALSIVLANLALYLIDETFLNLTGEVLLVLRYTFASIFWIFLAIVFFFFVNALAESLAAINRLKLKGIQLAYSRAIFFVFSIILSIAVLVVGLSKLGVSLIPLFTGIGIGGIAVAVAAKSLLENIIGSFVIFSNKPYRMGHRILVLGHEGWVEEIGLNATKLRLLNGELAVIPNQNIIGAEIINLTERPYHRRDFTINLSFSDEPIKLESATKIISEVLSIPTSWKNDPAKHPNAIINHNGKKPKVFVRDIKGDNQILEIIYWYQSNDWWAFKEFNHQINQLLVKRFNEEGIDFAMPTQSIEIKSHKTGPDQSIKL